LVVLKSDISSQIPYQISSSPTKTTWVLLGGKKEINHVVLVMGNYAFRIDKET